MAVSPIVGPDGITRVDALATPYGYKGELPPELAIREQALNRRQQIANLLLQRGLVPPQGQMAGRFYVPPNWAQGLAQLGTGIAGYAAGRANDQESRGISEASQQMLADAVANYKQGTSDVPAVAGSLPPPPQAAVAEAMAPPPTPPPAPFRGIAPATTSSPSVFSGNYPMGPDASGWEPKGPIQDLNASATPMLAPQQAVAQAMAPQAPLQGPVVPGSPGRPRTPEEKRQALIDLMASQHPQARELGKLLETQQTRADELATNREFMGEQRGLDRENRIATAQAQMGQNIVLATMAGASKEQIAEMKASNDKLIQEMRGASAENVATIAAQAKTDVQGMKGGRGAAMSATAQKELIQTEEELQGSHQAIKSFEAALELNDKAMGFTGAGALAGAGSLLPESMRPASVDATVQLDNILQTSALPQLKAIFGGMPTEGERKILLDVQGSSNKTPSQRKEIIERAIQMARNRIKFGEQKAEQLRKGTYFSGEGGLDTSADAPLTNVPTTQGKPNAFQPFHDPDEEAAYQKWKLEHK